MYPFNSLINYINGMLDAIARYLIHTGKMMKVMPERHENTNKDNQTNKE